MQNFPKWLPQNVAEHCRVKIESKVLTDEQHECIMRLTTNESMRTAWGTLEKVLSKNKKLDPRELVALLEYVRLLPQSYKPKLSHANQRDMLQQISIQSKSLIDSLAQLDVGKQDADNGIAILQSKISLIQKQALLIQDGEVVVHLHELLKALKEIDAAFGIAATLQLLQKAAELAVDAPLEGPRKQGAKTVSRTLFIKELKSYINTNFDKKLNQVVADIVNVAMDLPPDTVTEDMVRKA